MTAVDSGPSPARTGSVTTELLTRLEIANEPRAERYLHLPAVINRWPVPPSLAPVFTWFTAALRVHTGQ